MKGWVLGLSHSEEILDHLYTVTNSGHYCDCRVTELYIVNYENKSKASIVAAS